MKSSPSKVIKDEVYEGMYRLVWEDAVLSEDMYNETRANDILNNYDYYIRNMEMYGNQRASNKNRIALDCIP